MTVALARGEVVLPRFPVTDLSGSSLRPALVVSVGLIGQDLILAGISSVFRAAVFSDIAVERAHPQFALTGLRVPSVIRLHKLAAVEHTVLARRLGRIGPLLQAEVDQCLRKVLGL